MGVTHICQYGSHPFCIIYTVIDLTFKRIRDLREDHDIKQKDIAKMLLIDQSTYSDYENGRINVPIEALIKLADFYKTSIDYIVGRTEE